jgi:hypothetical protein
MILPGAGLALFLAMCFGELSPAGPLVAPHSHTSVVEGAVHIAEHRVDEAWEVYHEAALGGTLASPALQAQIEQDLHDARRLLVQAREAAGRGNEEALHEILDRIEELSARAIQGSREKKK